MQQSQHGDKQRAHKQKWTENTDKTCHIQGGDITEESASICDDLWRTPVADQEYSHRHGTNADTVQSLHFQISTSDATQTDATNAWCGQKRARSHKAPTDESK